MKKAKTGKRKIGKWILAGIGILLVIFLFGTYRLFREEMQIIGSIQKEKDNPFYEMTFHTDYHMDEILQKKIKSDDELAEVLAGYISHGFYKPEGEYRTEIGCSTITARTSDGRLLWGRNFDWDKSTPIVVKSIPEKGYRSIATCEFGNITGDENPNLDSMGNKFLAVASYYVPMDGINEKGLCVADLEVNEGGMVTVDTKKPDITVTMAIRLLLNRAANVEEAVALLKQYDVFASGGISHHLSMADATGRSVSVEFVEGEIIVVETPCVTNFNMANGDITAGGENAQERYLILQQILQETGGIMDKDQVQKALLSVRKPEGQWTTRWSIVYEYAKNQADNGSDENNGNSENTGSVERDESVLSLDYYFDGDFERKYTIGL